MLGFIWQKRVRRTTLITLGSLSFVVGIWCGQYFGLTGWLWLVLALCLLVGCAYKRAVVALTMVILAGGILGMWQGGQLASDLVGYKEYVGQKISLTGIVVEDASYNDKKQQDFRLRSVRIDGRELPGQVRITTFNYQRPHRGDEVMASGKLMSGFGNYQAAIYYAQTEVVKINTGLVEALRRSFAASMYTNLPEPQASLGLGFLVGIKSQLPDSLNDQLRDVGLTHIVVASGYNLTILVRVARRIFAKSSKYQTAVVALGLMASFVAVTGFGPSMSRAALVTGLSLAAWYYGRQAHPLVILSFSAAVTAMINPLFVWYDLGWWLSFLAFAGVMLLAPLVQHRLFGDREPKLIGQMVIETLCAEVMTLPLIIAVFGSLPLLALPANVLIVPLVPLAMLLGFVAGVAGWLTPYLALPATWLLTFMTDVVKILATPDWAVMPLAMSWIVMMVSYVFILLAGLVLWRATRHDYLTRSYLE